LGAEFCFDSILGGVGLEAVLTAFVEHTVFEGIEEGATLRWYR
jgi:hypothetical protein